jgi:hypothetical protein
MSDLTKLEMGSGLRFDTFPSSVEKYQSEGLTLSESLHCESAGCKFNLPASATVTTS